MFFSFMLLDNMLDDSNHILITVFKLLLYSFCLSLVNLLCGSGTHGTLLCTKSATCCIYLLIHSEFNDL